MPDKIRTKLVDKNVYIKWYNVAEEIINNHFLIPKRKDKEIYQLVSRENWLIFALDGQDKDDAINSENPNVFLDILSKEGNLTGEARLGLTFNNLKAYEKFKTIMQGYNREIKNKVTSKLLELRSDWKINIKRKIKKFNYAQKPEYYEVKEWNSNQINDKIIDELTKIGNSIREKGKEAYKEEKIKGKFYRETPSINLMESIFKLDKEEFKIRILEIFEILALCLKVKTDIEIKRIKKEKINQLSQKEIELKNEKEHKRQLEFLEQLNKIDKEQIRIKQEKIERLEKEISQIKKEAEENA